jgi:hypothetical protein
MSNAFAEKQYTANDFSAMETEKMQISSADNFPPGRMLEPVTTAYTIPVQIQQKQCKWHPLPIEFLAIDLLPQHCFLTGQNALGDKCKNLSVLLFPFHYSTLKWVFMIVSCLP